MVDKEDIELVRTGYNAFVAGDMEWLNEHLHANVVWHAAGRSSLAGDYRGREEVLASFANSVQIAMPEFEIHDVAAGEDHVVTVLDVTWRRPDGGTFEGKAVQVLPRRRWQGPGVVVRPRGPGRPRCVPRGRVRLAFATSGSLAPSSTRTGELMRGSRLRGISVQRS